MQTYGNNGEQNKQEDKLLTTNFEVKVKNRKVEGLITYSTDQQIFKLKVNSETDQEVWGVYIDFQSIHSKWMIDAILQHMGFYVTTENPNVMMRENHNTLSSEYIILCQAGLFIVSTIPDEILHMLKDKYKINIYLQDKYPHDPGGRDTYYYRIKEYLEHLYENMNIPPACWVLYPTNKLILPLGSILVLPTLLSVSATTHISPTTLKCLAYVASSPKH